VAAAGGERRGELGGGQAGGRHHFVFYLCVYQNQSLQMRRCDACLAAEMLLQIQPAGDHTPD